MSTATDFGRVPEWTLADRLLKARTLAGLGQAELALLLGVSRSSVVNYEMGHTTPTQARIRLWAERTRVNAGWLETGTPSGRPSDGLPRLDSNQKPPGLRHVLRTFGPLSAAA